MNLSQRVAIAIGWSKESFVDAHKANSDCVKIRCEDGVERMFSIKDKNILWKLCAEYGQFPIKTDSGWIGRLSQGFFKTAEEAAVYIFINKQGQS